MLLLRISNQNQYSINKVTSSMVYMYPCIDHYIGSCQLVQCGYFLGVYCIYCSLHFRLSLYVSVCMSFRPSLSPTMSLSLPLYVCLLFSVSLSLCLSIYISLPIFVPPSIYLFLPSTLHPSLSKAPKKEFAVT